MKKKSEKFAKDAILESQYFARYKDLLGAILEDGAEYGKGETELLIEEYFKREI